MNLREKAELCRRLHGAWEYLELTRLLREEGRFASRSYFLPSYLTDILDLTASDDARKKIYSIFKTAINSFFPNFLVQNYSQSGLMIFMVAPPNSKSLEASLGVIRASTSASVALDTWILQQSDQLRSLVPFYLSDSGILPGLLSILRERNSYKILPSGVGLLACYNHLKVAYKLQDFLLRFKGGTKSGGSVDLSPLLNTPQVTGEII